MTCEHITLPGGVHAIVCGPRTSRVICDVCDKPVRKGAPQFTWRNRKIDLCSECRDNRERGDASWRAWAEERIAHNLGLAVEHSPP